MIERKQNDNLTGSGLPEVPADRCFAAPQQAGTCAEG